MGWGMGLEYVIFTKNPFCSGGRGEVQFVNLFLQRIQICKKWRGAGVGGGGLEYVIFVLKESKSKKNVGGG